MEMSAPPALKRLRLRVRGQVQGVGFRPHVYGLAQKYGLSGWVLNDGAGVLLEVQGQNISAFRFDLEHASPLLARVDHVEETALSTLSDERIFEIRHSEAGDVVTDIAADAAVCADCLAEMRNPDNRRHGYAFINCTHCGPRYTITHALPYDRPQTSMADFEMCGACASEYEDPLDRRFHAQPTCCPDCGPQLSMPVKEMASRIKSGEILAIKGLGGFHLVCDAQNGSAIKRLRERKNRDAKPFAVMVPTCEDAEKFTLLNDQERDLLQSAMAPIVLLQKTGNPLPHAIAPGLNRMGVMLPYTPLHHLLMDELGGQPLVMTSANPGGEPLVIDNEEAHERLSGICDAIVTHDRDILIRVDDSVARVDEASTTLIRRARGFTPSPVVLKNEGPVVLALGAYLKNTVCVSRGNHAYVSQHIGDLDNVATLEFYDETIEHLLSILRVKPDAVVHDLHPDFASSRKAQSFNVPAFEVQHHHAHIASVMAEHQLEGPVIGVALDGFGLGHCGESWGGEMFVASGLECTRVGHLAPLAQPGGDKAAREPWRMGVSALYGAGHYQEIAQHFGEHVGLETLVAMLNRGLNAPMTSSAGRLFDAACGLLGVCEVSRYEGHAPMMLESLVGTPKVLEQGWTIEDGVLDLQPTLIDLPGYKPQEGAEIFHGTFAAALADWINIATLDHGLSRVCLSGGCFLNHVLTRELVLELKDAGLDVYLNQQVPLSDAGLSLGQAWLGRQFLQQED